MGIHVVYVIRIHTVSVTNVTMLAKDKNIIIVIIMNKNIFEQIDFSYIRQIDANALLFDKFGFVLM